MLVCSVWGAPKSLAFLSPSQPALPSIGTLLTISAAAIDAHNNKDDDDAAVIIVAVILAKSSKSTHDPRAHVGSLPCRHLTKPALEIHNAC